MRRAEEAGLDLVEIAPNVRPPVCKILNYSKFKYEQSKKEKEAKSHQKTSQIKELRLSPRIETNDILIKCRHAREFLNDGHKVQFVLKFNRRELSHKELGFEVMKKIIAELQDVANNASLPKMNGNSLISLLEPKEKEKVQEKN